MLRVVWNKEFSAGVRFRMLKTLKDDSREVAGIFRKEGVTDAIKKFVPD